MEQMPPKPTISVDIRIIFDNHHYDCVVSQCGRFFRMTSGDFQESDKGLAAKINRLLEVAKDDLGLVVVAGTKNVSDYTTNLLIQPVRDAGCFDYRCLI